MIQFVIETTNPQKSRTCHLPLWRGIKGEVCKVTKEKKKINHHKNNYHDHQQKRNTFTDGNAAGK